MPPNNGNNRQHNVFRTSGNGKFTLSILKRFRFAETLSKLNHSTHGLVWRICFFFPQILILIWSVEILTLSCLRFYSDFVHIFPNFEWFYIQFLIISLIFISFEPIRSLNEDLITKWKIQVPRDSKYELKWKMCRLSDSFWINDSFIGN